MPGKHPVSFFILKSLLQGIPDRTRPHDILPLSHQLMILPLCMVTTRFFMAFTISLLWCDYQNCGSSVVDLLHQIHDLLGGFRIQVSGRLICQKECPDGLQELWQEQLSAAHHRKAHPGRPLYFPASPTSWRTSGTRLRITRVGLPMTRCANATFSYTFRSFKRRKILKYYPKLSAILGKSCCASLFPDAHR